MSGSGLWSRGILVVCISSAVARGEDPYPDPVRLLRRAAELAAALPDDPLSSKVSILAEIAGLQAASGDEEGSKISVEEAVKASGPPQWFSSARHNIRKNVLFTKAEARLRAGDQESSRIVLSEIRQIETQNPSPQPFQTLERLAVMQFRAGDNQGAMATVRTILAKAEALPATSNRVGRPDPHTRAEGMTVAARVFYSIAEADLAKKALDQVRISNDAIANRSQRLAYIESLLAARARNGDVAGAMAQLDSAGDLNLKGDPDAESRLIAAIASAAAENDVDAALGVASRIRDPLRRLGAIASVARKLSRAGQWQAASDAWNAAMQEDIAGSTRKCLADFALSQVRAGLLEDAKRTVSQALREADRPGDEFPSPYFYTRISEYYWLTRDHESANLYLRRAREMVDGSTSDRARKDIALNGIAGVLGSMGRFDEAVQIFSTSSVLDLDALSTVIGDAASSRLGVDDPAGASKLIDFLSPKIQNSWQVAEVVERVALLEARDGDARRSLRWAASMSGENKPHALLGVARGLLEKRSAK